MIRYALLASVLIGFSSLANATEWKQQTGSALTFAGEQQGEPFAGQFRRFDAHIQFDTAALADARFDVSIDIGSADTANSERDETMLGADFFDNAKFPKARFVTTAFRRVAAGKFEADATLTIRDKTVPLKFPFSWSGDAKSAELKAKVSLDRLAFGLGMGDWEDESSVGRKVDVNVYLKLAL